MVTRPIEWQALGQIPKFGIRTVRKYELSFHFEMWPLITVYMLGQKALGANFLTGSNWFVGHLGRAACTVHLISAQIS